MKRCEVPAARLHQAILAKAFSGQLVPQDPNDEPESVLLERIRAERFLHRREPELRKNGRAKLRPSEPSECYREV